MVHGDAYSRGDARTRPRADGRRRKDGRNRRDLCRRPWKNKHPTSARSKGTVPPKTKSRSFRWLSAAAVRSLPRSRSDWRKPPPDRCAQIDGKTVVYPDANHTTRYSAKSFRTDTVNHSIGEYVRGDAHTNTIESYFAILKRGIMGTYHHISQQHLKRYLCEFDFRYNERGALDMTDAERATKAVRGVVGSE